MKTLRVLLNVLAIVLVVAAVVFLWNGWSMVAAIGQILVAIWLTTYSGLDAIVETLRETRGA